MFAQSFSGQVLDPDHQAVAGATIMTPSAKRHAHSDERGFFVMKNVREGDTLLVSYLGYETIRIVLDHEHFHHTPTITLAPAIFDLAQVQVSNQSRALSQIADLDLKVDPVNSSQELLRRVPGLFIGQHAGGGKAEQIFLRGFDVDHGTDVNITVDGLPVNMVSHAHGQGYADLHFLIPETLEKIEFDKGPYYADQGNFNTAGFVNFRTKDQLRHSMVSLEAGRFQSYRMVGMIDLLDKKEHQDAYLATEYSASDGPFESPQDFRRFNLMGKYNYQTDTGDRLSFLLSNFSSRWDASGQIPERLVADGTIGRFGAVDDTEGGQTARLNVMGSFTKVIDRNRFVKTQAYFSHYDFELFSNFTFFLNDPQNGDQIRQREQRNIYGLRSSYHHTFGSDLELEAGVGGRYDDVNDVSLAHTLQRNEVLEYRARGDVNETNLYGYVDLKYELGKFLLNPALRLDQFSFRYNDHLLPATSAQTEQAALLAPKFNLLYNHSARWQWYLKTGIGFHSNDSRVVVARSGETILPKAYGLDIGTILKPAPRLWINTALWVLRLQQEFVYVGDEGIVEPSGKTIRKGFDVSIRYQLTDHLFTRNDLTYSHARASEEEASEAYIPLAPVITCAGGIDWQHPTGWNASLQYRYLSDRPANEDYSLTAQGYFLIDANVFYDFTDHLTLGLIAENILNESWREAQFATESRLSNEAQGIEEIHFTPGTPFFVKASCRLRF